MLGLTARFLRCLSASRARRLHRDHRTEHYALGSLIAVPAARLDRGRNNAAGAMMSEDQGAKLNTESAKLRAAVQSETDKRWEPFFDEMRGLLGGVMLALVVILFWSFVFDENPLSMLWPW